MSKKQHDAIDFLLIFFGVLTLALVIYTRWGG